MKDATEWKKSNTAEGKNPKWEPNENVTLELDGGQFVNIQLMDQDIDSDDLICSGYLDTNIIKDKDFEHTVELTHDGKSAGTFNIKLTLM